MAVLGVLTCEILELEFAWLIANEPKVSAVTVIEEEVSFGLMEALEKNGISPFRVPMVRSYTPVYEEGVEVLVRVMELGLHSRKKVLQDALIKASREMGRHVDAILLGYGLCGNALQNPCELLSDAGVPLIIPMDDDHPVDDCVGMIIGGRENYYGEQKKCAGTFFMIPGWTRHWKKMLGKEYGRFELEFLQRLFRMSNYERSLVIPSPVLSQEQMQDNVDEFSRLFGFRTEVRPGTLQILERAWREAIQTVSGDA